MQLNEIFKVTQCVAALLLVQCSVTTMEQNSSTITLEQTIEQQLERERSYGRETLERKRRYLEFPEGSSFQLVYDLIVGVVDYTNYLILGVTVALAWELPSKPPSEILNDLTDRLKDGTLGTTRNDSISHIKYVDVKSAKTTSGSVQYYSNVQPMFNPPMHMQYYPNTGSDHFYRANDYTKWDIPNGRKNNWHRKDYNYYTRKPTHPFEKWLPTREYKTSQNNPQPISKYPWWNLASRLNKSVTKLPLVSGSRRFDQNIKNLRNQNSWKSTGRAEHRIFPIFGKRSTSRTNEHNGMDSHRHHRRGIRSTDTFSKWDRMHVRHHRRTRQELYGKIETYLNGRGSSGHHCVLRALCETGQKSKEHKPGSFVAELMRAIFTLPEPFPEEGGTAYKQKRYDTANALMGDCAARYHLCKDSLWTSHFIM